MSTEHPNSFHSEMLRLWTSRQRVPDEPIENEDDINAAVSEMIQNFETVVRHHFNAPGNVSREVKMLHLCTDANRIRFINRESDAEEVTTLSQAISEDDLKNSDHRRLWRHIHQNEFTPVVRRTKGEHITLYAALTIPSQT